MTTANKPHLVLFTALVLLCTGCQELRTVTVTETSTTVVEKGTIVEQFIGDMGFGDFLNMQIADNTELKNQGIERAFIEQAHATSLTLSILAPSSGQDFDFLDKIDLRVSAPEQSQRRVAYGQEFAAGATRLSLQLDELNLAPYIKADSMDIISEVNGRRPAYDTSIEAVLTIDVLATVPGFGS